MPSDVAITNAQGVAILTIPTKETLTRYRVRATLPDGTTSVIEADVSQDRSVSIVFRFDVERLPTLSIPEAVQSLKCMAIQQKYDEAKAAGTPTEIWVTLAKQRGCVLVL